MCHLDEKGKLTIYNQDVKNFLIEHYRDKIQFAANSRKNESELSFSSKTNSAELAIKIKNLDVIRQVGESPNQGAGKVDSGLDDKFCDAQ